MRLGPSSRTVRAHSACSLVRSRWRPTTPVTPRVAEGHGAGCRLAGSGGGAGGGSRGRAGAIPGEQACAILLAMPSARLDRRRSAGAPYAALARRQNGGRCNVPALPFGEILRGARQARATFPTASATRAPWRGSAGYSATPGRSRCRPNTAPRGTTSPPGAPGRSPTTTAAIRPWPSSRHGSTAPRRPVPVRRTAAGAPDEQPPRRKAPEGPAGRPAQDQRRAALAGRRGGVLRAAAAQDGLGDGGLRTPAEIKAH